MLTAVTRSRHRGALWSVFVRMSYGKRFSDDEDVILQLCSLNDKISSSTMSAKDEIVLNVNDFGISITGRSVHDPSHKRGQFMKFLPIDVGMYGTVLRESCSHHIFQHSCLRELFHFHSSHYNHVSIYVITYSSVIWVYYLCDLIMIPDQSSNGHVEMTNMIGIVHRFLKVIVMRKMSIWQFLL